jgi:brefeldin A-inhibited guanine nucleotide-exchange protein
MKEELTRAAIKFKNKPKDGIAHLVKIGKCQDTPESIAAVFHELRDVLDKTAMGDYMGGEKEFNIKVLHAYVDQLDFTGMAFAQGIKHFLSGFRLPGEAQKIDRMMEKFAERYCSNNPEVFPTADTAFVLAYSVIMLNTDLHNPNIKPEKKMTKAGFISNNRGIAAGQDVPRQLLMDIFDEIESRPITLKEDDKLREQKQSEKEKASERRKREVLAKERADIVALGKDLFKSKPHEGAVGGEWLFVIAMCTRVVTTSARVCVRVSLQPVCRSDDEAVKPYYSVSQLAPADVLQYTRPMFEVTRCCFVGRFAFGSVIAVYVQVVWGPLIAVLSVSMELSEDPAVIETCLEGFKLGIHVAGALGMATERNSMVGALCNFTALDPISGPHAVSGLCASLGSGCWSVLPYRVCM